MGVEREYKFDVDPEWAPPDLGELAGGTEELADEHLVSTYFDTPDRRLWAAGMTLRHRAGKGDGGGRWTLKCPQPVDLDPQLSVRSETDWDGPLGAVPSEVQAEVSDVAAGRELVQLATLESLRRRCRLGAGESWAEVDDDCVTVTFGPRTGLRFRQVEVEMLREPDPKVLAAVLGALTAGGARPGGGSKIGLAAGLEPPAH
jgi:hypothetical protein